MSYTAMQHLDVSTAVLLSQTEAPLLVVLGALLLKERLSIRQGVGIVAALVGVVIIAGDPSVRQHYLAVALSLGSVGIWALGQVQIRNMGDVGGMQNLAWIALFGSPQLLLLSVLFENGQAHAVATADIRTWAEVFYLGLGMTCVGIGIWYGLIKKLPVARVAPFLLLVPVISAAGGVLLLGESLGVLQVIGGLVIISGVFATVSASPPPPETDRELHAEDKVLGRRTIQLSQADEQRKTPH
jgi:O-acetylserine/cysteine efflux transporter